jgi:hypothetical protein
VHGIKMLIMHDISCSKGEKVGMSIGGGCRALLPTVSRRFVAVWVRGSGERVKRCCGSGRKRPVIGRNPIEVLASLGRYLHLILGLWLWHHALSFSKFLQSL